MVLTCNKLGMLFNIYVVIIGTFTKVIYVLADHHWSWYVVMIERITDDVIQTGLSHFHTKDL